MRKTSRPKIKICCIGSLVEARIVIARGADAIGLVSEMPSGPGAIPDVGPYGLDVCSGVRTNSRLDEDKLAKFFAQVR